MTYIVKECFYTLQGEGAQTGTAAVFCRFSRCNLWSGKESDRLNAVCTFCDTDFLGTNGPGGGQYKTPDELAQKIESVWGDRAADKKYVVCTGGEPLLQLDTQLIDALHMRGFRIGVETNGTLPLPDGLDWVCVSPKANTKLEVREGDELKLVFPQEGVDPKSFEDLAFRHFFLQPRDGENNADHTHMTLTYCMENPLWRLSLQTHKILNIP